jgi:hypothetical protein
MNCVYCKICYGDDVWYCSRLFELPGVIMDDCKMLRPCSEEDYDKCKYNLNEKI